MRMNDKRTTGVTGAGSAFDYGNVEEFYADIRAENKKIHDELRRLNNLRIKEQTEKQRKDAEDILKEISELESRFGEMNSNERLKLAKREMQNLEKERAKQRAKNDTELAKKAFGVQTRYDKKRSRDEIVSRRRENIEALANYRKLRKAGVELTKEQKADERRAKS